MVKVKTIDGKTLQESMLLYRPLVRRIASRMHSRLPSSVQLLDLESEGMFGLIQAFDRYDSTKTVAFGAYARWRIRGSILDSLRTSDWIPHSVRRAEKKIARARESFLSRSHREPTMDELAEELGVSLKRCHKLLQATDTSPLMSLDAPITRSSQQETTLLSVVPAADDLEKEVAWSELVDLLRDCVRVLPERECTAITLYYFRDMPLKDVGAQMGVSESRACQLCQQGAKRIRSKLARHIDVDGWLSAVA